MKIKYFCKILEKFCNFSLTLTDFLLIFYHSKAFKYKKLVKFKLQTSDVFKKSFLTLCKNHYFYLTFVIFLSISWPCVNFGRDYVNTFNYIFLHKAIFIRFYVKRCFNETLQRQKYTITKDLYFHANLLKTQAEI